MLGRSARSRCLALAIPLALAALLAVAAPARAEDITPPDVTGFGLSPSYVDTTSAAQTVTVTFAIEDSQSGVDYAQVDLFAPDGSHSLRFKTELASGDASSGVYTGTCVMPRGSISGTWHAWVLASDALGNFVSAPWSRLDVLFGAGSSEVVNDATAWDSTAPQVTAVSITPSHVDTSAADQTVEIIVTVTDDQSGVHFAGGQLHGGASGNGQHVTVSLERVSGDELSGGYVGAATLPRYGAAGAWTLSLHTIDVVGNAFGIADLSERFGAAAQVINDAVVADAAPPLLTALTITPTEFDTESGARDLTVTASVTDDLTGVAWVTAIVRPMLSNQMYTADLKRASGDSLDGVWSGTITVPSGAEVGVWTTEIDVYDAISNWVWYKTDELNAMLPDAQGVTLVNTAAAEQVTVRKEWVLTGERSSVTFPAGTVVTRLDGGPFAFYRMIAQPFTFDVDVPTTDLTGTPVGTLRFGIPGLDLSFSQPVTVRMQIGTAYDGYLVSIQSLTEDGEAWANETTSEVIGGQAAFTVSHATRFSASPAKARVTDASPRRGRRAAAVTIVGRGFGKTRGRSVVLFNGRVCRDYSKWSPTLVRFTVPRTARPGRYTVKLRVNGMTTPVGRFKVVR